MDHGWNCPRCGESNEDDFALCWQCGTGRDGTPAGPAFRTDEASANHRSLDCLRCHAPMNPLGRKRLHEGSRWAPALFGAVGELASGREALDFYACPACGKVELFLPNA